MPELPSWLISSVLGAFTGGLAAAIFNLFVNWRKAENDKKQTKQAHINALEQELRHSRWLINYNYDRVTAKDPNKALTFIKTTNVERILFGAELSFPSLMDELHGYLEQIVYLNSVIADYKALPAFGKSGSYESLLKHIEKICTPNDTYDDRSEPSPRARINKLLDDLSEIKL